MSRRQKCPVGAWRLAPGGRFFTNRLRQPLVTNHQAPTTLIVTFARRGRRFFGQLRDGGVRREQQARDRSRVLQRGADDFGRIGRASCRERV